MKKRVVVIDWKNKNENQLEVFSNLKNLCIRYPQYNYNTLNNYLSKNKIAYENSEVRIERKIVNPQPVPDVGKPNRKIVPVLRKVKLKDADESQKDLEYWLQQSVSKRAEAVTFIISQSLSPGQRMDKTKVSKHKLRQ